MTDTTKTREELLSMAADELMLTSSGNAAEAEDLEKIDSRLDGMLGELNARGVIYIGDTDEFPIEWSSALAALLANECAPSFGRAKQDVTRVEERLRIMVNNQQAPNKYLKVDSALTTPGVYNYNTWLRGY